MLVSRLSTELTRSRELVIPDWWWLEQKKWLLHVCTKWVTMLSWIPKGVKDDRVRVIYQDIPSVQYEQPNQRRIWKIKACVCFLRTTKQNSRVETTLNTNQKQTLNSFWSILLPYQRSDMRKIGQSLLAEAGSGIMHRAKNCTNVWGETIS